MLSSVSLEAVFVWRLFADGKLTVARQKLRDKVTRLCCMSDMGLNVSVLRLETRIVRLTPVTTS